MDLSPEGDDFVVTMGTSNSFTPGPQFSAVVTRRDGSVVAHSLANHTVSAPVAVPMSAPA